MTDAHVPTDRRADGRGPGHDAPDVVVPHEHDRAPSSGRRRTPLGIAVRVVVVLAAIGLTYYVVTLYQVWSTGRATRPDPSTRSWCSAPPSTTGGRRRSWRPARPRRRAVAAGLAPIVVVTGGKQPEDRFTEAEASAGYLVDHGVPEDAIVLENAGRSTYESLEGVADVLARAWAANRPARHRPVPLAAEPADRRGGGPRGLRVADPDERRDRWVVVHEAPPGGRRQSPSDGSSGSIVSVG